jgi:hypothetical protein
MRMREMRRQILEMLLEALMTNLVLCGVLSQLRALGVGRVHQVFFNAYSFPYHYSGTLPLIQVFCLKLPSSYTIPRFHFTIGPINNLFLLHHWRAH